MLHFAKCPDLLVKVLCDCPKERGRGFRQFFVLVFMAVVLVVVMALVTAVIVLLIPILKMSSTVILMFISI